MTFEELEETVIPRLGICYRELSFREVITAYNGIIKERIDQYEFNLKTTHNAARLQAFFVVRAIPFLKHYPKQPTDLMCFPWEKDSKKLQKPTPEQWEEYKKVFPDKLPGYDTRSDRNINKEQ